MTETKGAGYSRTTLWVLFCCCVAPLDGNVYGSVSTQETVTGNYQGIGYKLDAWSQYDNPEEAGRQEGDIELAPASRKTVTRREKLLWPNGVVKYHVHESIASAPSALAVLEDAMEEIERRTCIKFERVRPDARGRFPGHSWVNITGHEKGCWSDLGRSPWKPTYLNLEVDRCFRTRGHAVHEFLHTLGVYHEHMRSDRDRHVKVVWENIKKGDAFNFRVLAETEANTFGLPYDYDSIMHYPMTAFSVNKSSPTLIPLRKNARIGQRIHLSFYDIEKLLISYECKTFNADNLYMALGHGHPDVLQLLSFNVSKLYKLQSFKHLKDYKDAFKNYGSPDFDDFDSRRHFRRERISNDY
ncbi:zinc metalloproteinase nas-14-like isoform X1 [Orussus abietinus]|uniref:zinc metalloproteinase nas-14-like isoform X1 n=1 Tax=Orussus abietinus TaxID=222816 RepID=UPI0006259171|nr:zinc metalloproteinase nas-14-like isoform X1 [Orussus abietinus]